ncbi:MAG: DUF1361 domain-containing protein [Chloroflexi bacterium]|nr:DUF1361 domain-containing protein [Chloroflexota bacterium]
MWELWSKHKYKIGIFLLLLTASMIAVSLVIVRVLYTDSRRHVSLIWNLFLAWIPFLLAYMAYVFSWRRWMVYLIVPGFLFLWLLFFPNAPYVLTDLQDLARSPHEMPIWYDALLLNWFSWSGALLGVVSLYLMQEILLRHFGRLVGWLFVLSVSAATGLGLYLGRFIRLNSWDLFRAPREVVEAIWGWLADPSLSSVGFVSLYTLFFLFIYLTLYAFGHILQEGQKFTGRQEGV